MKRNYLVECFSRRLWQGQRLVALQTGVPVASSGEASEASQSSGESQEPSGEVITLRCGGWGRIDTEHEPGVIGMAEAIGINVEFQKYPTVR